MGKYRKTKPEIIKLNKITWTGEKIRALRQKLNLTQQELAAELGTRQQTISEWETNMYSPRGTSSRLLSIIAEKANIEYESLRSEQEIAHSTKPDRSVVNTEKGTLP